MYCHCYILRVGSTHNEEKSEEIKNLEVLKTKKFLTKKEKKKTHQTSVRKWLFRTSPVAQWLRICLPRRGTRGHSPVWEDPTGHGATKPMRHSYGACALEPGSCNYQSLHAPQPMLQKLEKPPQQGAHMPQREKSRRCNEGPAQPKIKITLKKISDKTNTLL